MTFFGHTDNLTSPVGTLKNGDIAPAGDGAGAGKRNSCAERKAADFIKLLNACDSADPAEILNIKSKYAEAYSSSVLNVSDISNILKTNFGIKDASPAKMIRLLDRAIDPEGVFLLRSNEAYSRQFKKDAEFYNALGALAHKFGTGNSVGNLLYFGNDLQLYSGKILKTVAANGKQTLKPCSVSAKKLYHHVPAILMSSNVHFVPIHHEIEKIFKKFKPEERDSKLIEFANRIRQLLFEGENSKYAYISAFGLSKFSWFYDELRPISFIGDKPTALRYITACLLFCLCFCAAPFEGSDIDGKYAPTCFSPGRSAKFSSDEIVAINRQVAFTVWEKGEFVLSDDVDVENVSDDRIDILEKIQPVNYKDGGFDYEAHIKAITKMAVSMVKDSNNNNDDFRQDISNAVDFDDAKSNAALPAPKEAPLSSKAVRLQGRMYTTLLTIDRDEVIRLLEGLTKLFSAMPENEYSNIDTPLVK